MKLPLGWRLPPTLIAESLGICRAQNSEIIWDRRSASRFYNPISLFWVSHAAAVAILTILRSKTNAFPLSTVIIEQYRPPVDKFVIGKVHFHYISYHIISWWYATELPAGNHASFYGPGHLLIPIFAKDWSMRGRLLSKQLFVSLKKRLDTKQIESSKNLLWSSLTLVLTLFLCHKYH